MTFYKLRKNKGSNWSSTENDLDSKIEEYPSVAQCRVETVYNNAEEISGKSKRQGHTLLELRAAWKLP